MDSPKKQIPLRISDSLWNEINRWAADEFRSVNGQIEYILTEAVRRRKKAREDAPRERGDEGAGREEK